VTISKRTASHRRALDRGVDVQHRMGSVLIGTAGWSVPRQEAHRFPAEGSTLERYSARFPMAEINSSFHRPHRISTWQRWHDSVPAEFRFSVKVPKVITHERKLADCEAALDKFIAQAAALGDKLAVLLVQLPPKLQFSHGVAASFFASLIARSTAAIVCEPRHPSWFDEGAEALLASHKVARVAADPAICDAADVPGGWRGLSYWRLHGSPVIYRSSYAERIGVYAQALAREAQVGRDVWCIFDNTASSAGAGDALRLMEALQAPNDGIG
jgi:uncharacterized protein YecE (DUF72 family)